MDGKGRADELKKRSEDLHNNQQGLVFRICLLLIVDFSQAFRS